MGPAEGQGGAVSGRPRLACHDNNDQTSAVCAFAGQLEEPINFGKVCHVVRQTESGAEMRSRFWLGHVAMREGNETRLSVATPAGDRAARPEDRATVIIGLTDR